MNDTGFPPIVGLNPKILILGSMPSQKSLEKQQYYGHPQNAFWKIMAKAFGFSENLEYYQKTKLVKENGIAIWDVIHCCTRSGSLDSSIQKDTIVENKIPELLEQFPGIQKILCNGGTSHQLFLKHFKIWSTAHPEIEIIKMPSTSPAHASLNFEQKYDVWIKTLFEN